MDLKRSLKPSNKAPSRENGEYQAWVSVNNQVLEKPLDKLKRMVLAVIFDRVGVTTVILRVRRLICRMRSFFMRVGS
jgi:hypothetical protein